MNILTLFSQWDVGIMVMDVKKENSKPLRRNMSEIIQSTESKTSHLAFFSDTELKQSFMKEQRNKSV